MPGLAYPDLGEVTVLKCLALLAMVLPLTLAAAPGDSWPPDPPNVSADCGRNVLYDQVRLETQARHWSNEILLATDAVAQLTKCADEYHHPSFLLIRAVFEQSVALGYFNQSDYVAGDRYVNLAQADLQYVQMYKDLPANVEALLTRSLKFQDVAQRRSGAQTALSNRNPSSGPSAQAMNEPPETNSDQGAGNLMNQPGPLDDRYAVRAMGCTGAPQRPANAVWTAVALSFGTLPPEPKTLLGVVFENLAQVPLTDLRVHYDFVDAFGDIMASEDGVWSGSFSPNTIINFGTLGGNGILEHPPLANASQAKGVKCYISGARWSDGTVRAYAPNGRPDGVSR